MKFEFHDVEQNSDEWFNLRGGKLTLSKLKDVMANYGKKFGDPARKYAIKIAVEQITGNPIPSEYSNEKMDMGHVYEPIAKELYEQKTFSEVTNGGFFCSDTIGGSPDGLVGKKGGVEIKSITAGPHTHYDRVERQDMDPTHKWQCIGFLKYSGRDWMDFISYCGAYPNDQQIFVYRLKKEDLQKEFEMIGIRVEEFFELVAEIKENILKRKYFLNMESEKIEPQPKQTAEPSIEDLF